MRSSMTAALTSSAPSRADLARVVPPPAGATARERLLQLTGVLDTHEPPTVIGPVDAAEAADALLGFLRRTGHLEAEDAADAAAR